MYIVIANDNHRDFVGCFKTLDALLFDLIGNGDVYKTRAELSEHDLEWTTYQGCNTTPLALKTTWAGCIIDLRFFNDCDHLEYDADRSFPTHIVLEVHT